MTGGPYASSSFSVSLPGRVSTLPNYPRHPIPKPPSPSTMARLLARTLTLARPPAPRSTLRPLRALSDKVELIEIDLSEDSATSSSTGAAGDSTEEPMGMRRLNDAIHGVLVRRAAPEWLPLVPGGSYWVPPIRRPLGVSDLVGTVVYSASGAVDTSAMARAAMDRATMTKEEVMCFTTPRGWPSEAYFVDGKLWHPVKRSRKDATQTDDEEG